MKKKTVRTLSAAALVFILTACGLFADSGEAENDRGTKTMTVVNMTVGGKTFSVRFCGNETVRALLSKMPMTLAMSDLNGNEKFYNLRENLPASRTERPSTIQAGEIMLWSGDTLVLFYKTFSNSYGGYVRLGYVEDTAGLAAALGTGSAEVTFAVPEL